MKHWILTISLLIITTTSGWAQTAVAPSGSGTEADPYQIATLQNLYWISQNSASWGSYFKQTADIDATETNTWVQVYGFDQYVGLLPIGTSGNPFSGTYDGGGYVIRNLYMDARQAGGYIFTNHFTDVHGLFGYVNSAEIKNIGLISPRYFGRAGGGLIATIRDSVIISGNYIKNLYIANGTGIIYRFEGGLFGSTHATQLEIRNNYVEGRIDLRSSSGAMAVGAGLGSVLDLDEANIPTNYSNHFYNNYSSVKIYGDSLETQPSEIGDYFGAGHIVTNRSLEVNDYWNSDSVSRGYVNFDTNEEMLGVTGLSSDQMKDSSSFSGFDFLNDWGINQGNGFPYLKAFSFDRTSESISAVPASGSGTDVDPYLIGTPENVFWISQDSSLWNSHFKQTADIDLSASATWHKNLDEIEHTLADVGFSPIGNAEVPFSGTYDGDGYTISGLNINRASDNIGLFGYVEAAEIKNLGLINPDVTGAGTTGALIGQTTGVLESGSYTNTKITNSFVSGASVNGEIGVGGLTGISNYTTFTNNYATGSISGDNSNGGLSGLGYIGNTFTNNYASVTHTSANGYVGGFLGGQLTGNVYTGGYWNSDSISTGVGFFQHDEVNGLTTTQMQKSASYPEFDFVKVWGIDEGNGLPYLLAFNRITNTPVTTAASGSGTEADPYLITSLSNLYWLSQDSSLWSNHFKLTANIDASSSRTWDDGDGWARDGFSPIGTNTTPFSGEFDGEEFTISGLYIYRPTTDSVGLFGVIDDGTVKNLGLTQLQITGKNIVGGLSGLATGSNIDRSFAQGTVTADSSKSGGMLGVAHETTITNSYATGTVNAFDIVGGLVGALESNSTAIDNYSFSSIGSGTNKGGFIGSISASTVSDGYWNSDSASTSVGTGGSGSVTITGLTTSQMYSRNSYTGFDFNNTWTINEGNGTPYLLPLDAPTSTPPAGSGTEADPYLVASLENLYWISQNSDSWGSYFKQTEDIDASATSEWNIGGPNNAPQGFTPIGNGHAGSSESLINFTGTYDGDYHTITGLYIVPTSFSYVGLFGRTDGAVIKNLGLIENNVGSFFGYDPRVGGLIGYAKNSVVTQNYVSGIITGNENPMYAGGLIGAADSSNVTNNYVQGRTNVYGLFSGGLIGALHRGNTVQNNYTSIGFLRLHILQYDEFGYIDEVRGDNNTVSGFWNSDSTNITNPTNSGQGNTISVTGLSTSQMQSAANFPDFDFNTVWGIEEGEGFPYLRGFHPVTSTQFATAPNGSGTEGDPYQIATLQNLYWVSQNSSSWSAYFVQTADIDASSTSTWDDDEDGIYEGFLPIGNLSNGTSTAFRGSYDGGYHTISGMYVNRPADDYVGGLFGIIYQGTVSNLGLIEADVFGNRFVGGISGAAAYLRSTRSASNLFFSGIVKGSSDTIGGLFGYSSDTEINNSYVISNLQGANKVGGLVGEARTVDVETSFSSVKIISSGSTIGALVGITSQSDVINSYWNSDMITTGIGELTNHNPEYRTITITGLNAVEMKSEASYEEFDFEELWTIEEGATLPYFSWSSFRAGGPVITGNEGWHMYGSPFDGSSFRTLTHSLWTQGFDGASTTSGASNIYAWDEATGAWLAPDSLGASVSPGQGFITYVYEDDEAETAGTQGGFPKSIIAAGHSQNLPVTFETPKSGDINEAGSMFGFSLIANPTTSTLDFEEFQLSEDVLTSYAVWDPVGNHYDAYQIGGASLNGGTQYIAPFQAFWVRSIGIDQSITIDSAAISTSSATLYKETNSPELYTAVIHVENEEGFSDEISLTIREGAKEGFDAYDMQKMDALSSTYVAVSTIQDSLSYAIDSRPKAQKLVYPLSLKTSGMVSTGILSLSGDRIPEDWKIELVNRETNSRYDLREESIEVELAEMMAKSTSGMYQPKVLKSSRTSITWQVEIQSEIVTGMEEGAQLPTVFGLDQNYPNPFNPSTRINYQLPENSRVSLQVFDMLGRKVATLLNGRKEAGYHQLQFDASHLASGVYIYRLKAGNQVLTKKLTLIK